MLRNIKACNTITKQIMQPSNNKNFDSELQAYFGSIKRVIKEEHINYLKNHPELRQILNDYLSSCLLEQPDDVYKYAQKFFSFFNYQKDTVRHPALIITGANGTGKVNRDSQTIMELQIKQKQQGTTIVNRLLSAMPHNVELSISYTTRRPRQGQVHGREYFFVTKEEFEKEVSKDVFAQYSEVNGNYYGTHRGKLNSIISRGKVGILDIDLEGAEKIRANFPNYCFVCIAPPSIETLRERLTKIKESPQVVEKLVKKGEKQLEQAKSISAYSYIVNKDVNDCVKQLVELVNKTYKFESHSEQS